MLKWQTGDTLSLVEFQILPRDLFCSFRPDFLEATLWVWNSEMEHESSFLQLTLGSHSLEKNYTLVLLSRFGAFDPLMLFLQDCLTTTRIDQNWKMSHPNSSRDELMCCASLSLSPSACVFLSRSLPAKSHLLINLSIKSSVSCFSLAFCQLKIITLLCRCYKKAKIHIKIQKFASVSVSFYGRNQPRMLSFYRNLFGT